MPFDAWEVTDYSIRMSARKVDGILPVTAAGQTRLSLPANAIRIHRGGIEFDSDTPLALWKEMTVSLQSPRHGRKINCTGVIVACNGTRHAGYKVSMLFTSISRQSQSSLAALSALRAS